MYMTQMNFYIYLSIVSKVEKTNKILLVYDILIIEYDKLISSLNFCDQY